MKNTKLKGAGYIIAIAIVVGLVAPARALAHCDGLDGPVVKSARKALETGNVKLVLIWVLKKDETEVVRAFEKTLAVRKLGGEARELSDTYFFETLVRIHRAGEGEPYTGLKPAGRDLGPAMEAADRAIETGEIAPLADLLNKAMRDGLAEQRTTTKMLWNPAASSSELMSNSFTTSNGLTTRLVDGLKAITPKPNRPNTITFKRKGLNGRTNLWTILRKE